MKKKKICPWCRCNEPIKGIFGSRLEKGRMVMQCTHCKKMMIEKQNVWAVLCVELMCILLIVLTGLWQMQEYKESVDSLTEIQTLSIIGVELVLGYCRFRFTKYEKYDSDTQGFYGISYDKNDLKVIGFLALFHLVLTAVLESCFVFFEGPDGWFVILFLVFPAFTVYYFIYWFSIVNEWYRLRKHGYVMPERRSEYMGGISCLERREGFAYKFRSIDFPSIIGTVISLTLFLYANNYFTTKTRLPHIPMRVVYFLAVIFFAVQIGDWWFRDKGDIQKNRRKYWERKSGLRWIAIYLVAFWVSFWLTQGLFDIFPANGTRYYSQIMQNRGGNLCNGFPYFPEQTDEVELQTFHNFGRMFQVSFIASREYIDILKKKICVDEDVTEWYEKTEDGKYLYHSRNPENASEISTQKVGKKSFKMALKTTKRRLLQEKIGSLQEGKRIWLFRSKFDMWVYLNMDTGYVIMGNFE